MSALLLQQVPALLSEHLIWEVNAASLVLQSGVPDLKLHLGLLLALCAQHLLHAPS